MGLIYIRLRLGQCLSHRHKYWAPPVPVSLYHEEILKKTTISTTLWVTGLRHLIYIVYHHNWPLSQRYLSYCPGTSKCVLFMYVYTKDGHYILIKLFSLCKTCLRNTCNGFLAWICNCIHIKLWDIITHPCPYFNGGLIKPPLKLAHGWVISSHVRLKI